MPRVLICRVGEPPTVEDVLQPFSFAKNVLLDNAHIQSVPLENGVWLYCDEDGLAKDLPFNRLVPARMPQTPEGWFVVDTTKGDHPAPGEMGAHRIFGNFLLTRHDDDGENADLTLRDLAMWNMVLSYR